MVLLRTLIVSNHVVLNHVEHTCGNKSTQYEVIVATSYRDTVLLLQKMGISSNMP